MKKITLILFALFTMLGSARAQSSGEYKAFVYNRPTGCIGQTTEEGLVPDCYDATQNWARYTWSYALKQYVPAPHALLTVAKLPACTDPNVKAGIAVVSDSTLTCVAGNALTGGGINVCPVYCNGTSWTILGSAGGGGGGGGVATVSGTPPITITGSGTSPIINLTTPLATQYGGTGIASPTAHTLPIAEGSSAFTLLTGTLNLPLIGQGAGSDPVFAALNLAGVGVTGILPLTNGGTGANSPTTVASLPTCNSGAKGTLDTVSDSTNTCVDGTALTGGGSNICVVFCNGTAWQMVGTVSGSVGLVNPMTTLGDIIYENATPAPARLAGNTTTTQKFLSQTGTGSVSAAPSWSTISGAGAIACTALPALTGDATSSAGSCATTVSAIDGVAIAPTTNNSASGSITLNMAANRTFRLVLTGNITSMTCSNPVSGVTYEIKTKQGAGPYTVSWCSQIDWGSPGAPTLSATSGKWDVFNCSYDSTGTVLNCAVAGQGFAN